MHTGRVIKNSLWLIVQPLILNIISIAAAAYIARTLGQTDYGRFIFTLSFVGLFLSLNHLGLRVITIREIAENKNITNVFLSKMLPLRIFVSIISVAVIFIAINMMHYPTITKYSIYIFSLTLIFNSFIQTFSDCFQAYEKMKYVAWTQFISGAILTLLSVIVLFIGYRLIGLVTVYTFGSLIAAFVAFFYIKKITKPRICLDYNFWKKSFLQGAPFYFPGLIGLLGSKIGVLLLSKMTGDISVGIYGAASSLTERIAIIPDGVSAAFLPAMAALYQSSKEHSAELFSKFFLYLTVLGLPIAIGTTILSPSIIQIIYGEGYSSSSIVLQLLIWLTFLTFLGSLSYSTIVVLRQERKIAIIGTATAIIFVSLNLYLIPRLKEVGLALSSLITGLVYLITVLIITKHYIPVKLFTRKTFFPLMIANLFMAACVYLFRNNFLLIPVLLGVASYAIILIWLKIFSISDVVKYYNQYIKPKIVNVRRNV